MLGLSESKDDSCCDYEQRSIVTKPQSSKTRDKKESVRNYFPPAKDSQPQKGSYVAVEEQDFATRAGIRDEDFGQVNASSLSMEESNFLREKQNEEKIDQENSVTFYSSPEQNEENSKAFMESLGSWINDLFNVPTKSSSLPVESGTEKKVYKEAVLDEDPEYLKSISAIKEQFRKKLKSETSIQVSVPEKPFTLNFDMTLETEKKSRKSKSLPPSTPTDWLQDLNVFDEEFLDAGENSLRRYSPLNATGLIIRTNDLELDLKPLSKSKNNLKELNNSILLKEKKRGKWRNRQDISELEEYVFPTSAELSQRILLNVSENDKYSKFYKNAHLGVQESQHYGQRKSKSHQTNARCYTTNANLTDSSTHRVAKKQFGGSSQKYCTTTAVAAAAPSTDEILRRNTVDLKKNSPRRPSKKEISEITRDVMSFSKMKPPKIAPTDSPKGEKSSDELVKYLMKKIKTTRSHTPRVKPSSTVPQIVPPTKNRLMQSATNTLVSVMAKGENQLPVKTSNRIFPENKPFPGKELALKQDANMRVDVSRAIASSKFSRLSYLLEDSKFEEDLDVFEKNTLTSQLPKRSKRNLTKINKRLEIKNMLSKIDGNYRPLKKPKERKKVEVPTMDVKEEQNARFQKQHELFRTTLKSAQANSTPESTEAKNEEQSTPANASCSSTELAVIDPDPQLCSENSQEKPEETEQVNIDLAQSTITDPPSELDYEVGELLDLDVKPITKKPEKQEKIFNAKSLNFLKDSDSKVMLSPLEKLCMCEQGSRDSTKTHESPLCPTELGQVKSQDTVVFNRRFSTNSLTESIPKFKPVSWGGAPAPKPILFLVDSDKEDKSDKTEGKDKKKSRSPRSSPPKDGPGDNCGFDKDKKKPGPNCEKDE